MPTLPLGVYWIAHAQQSVTFWGRCRSSEVEVWRNYYEKTVSDDLKIVEVEEEEEPVEGEDIAKARTESFQVDLMKMFVYYM